MSDLPVIPLVDEGLGNSAHLVDLGDGRALAIVLGRAGVADAALLIGGPQDWANAATGRAVQVDA